MRKTIPEMISGDIYLVHKPEFNATQLWQIRGGKSELLTEFVGVVEQIDKEKKNE